MKEKQLSQLNASSIYLNKVGDEGAYRLHILNDIHGPYSREFLKKVGLMPGMTVLEVGCGTGNMACWIAEQVGVNGTVYALDSSENQLRVAKENAKNSDINTINFMHLCIYDLDKLLLQFDLIYCRYVLLHLKDVDKALAIMCNKLKPGGIIACEEPTISTAFCYPESSAYKKSRELMQRLAEIAGFDFEIGVKLLNKFKQVGYTDAVVNLVQPTLKDSYERKMLTLMMHESMQHYISYELSSKEEIMSIIKSLEEISHDPEYLIGFPRTTQIYAKKQILQPKYFAFFDVDETIISIKSMFSFLKFFLLQEAKWFKPLGYLKFFFIYYKLKFLSKCGKPREVINALYYKEYKGKIAQFVHSCAELWYTDNCRNNPHFYNQKVIDEIHHHKINNAKIILVSGSFEACLLPIAKDLNCDAILATNLEAIEGRYTGNILGIQMIGNGKAEAIKQYLENYKFITTAACYAYGDHISDLSFLKLVGHPVAVINCKQLETYAINNGWKTIYVETN
jgi:HAD superfamily hydrolase (TIGR01490 family)